MTLNDYEFGIESEEAYEKRMAEIRNAEEKQTIDDWESGRQAALETEIGHCSAQTVTARVKVEQAQLSLDEMIRRLSERFGNDPSQWSQHNRGLCEKRRHVLDIALEEQKALDNQIADLKRNFRSNLQQIRLQTKMAHQLISVTYAENALAFIAAGPSFDFLKVLASRNMLADFYQSLEREMKVFKDLIKARFGVRPDYKPYPFGWWEPDLEFHPPEWGEAVEADAPFFGCVPADDIPVQFREMMGTELVLQWNMAFGQTKRGKVEAAHVEREEIKKAKATADAKIASINAEMERVHAQIHHAEKNTAISERQLKAARSEVEILKEKVQGLQESLDRLEKTPVDPKANSSQRRNFMRKIHHIRKLLAEAREELATRTAEMSALSKEEDSSDCTSLEERLEQLHNQREEQIRIAKEKARQLRDISIDSVAGVGYIGCGQHSQEISEAERGRRQRRKAREFNHRHATAIKAGKIEAKKLADPTGFYRKKHDSERRDREARHQNDGTGAKPLDSMYEDLLSLGVRHQ